MTYGLSYSYSSCMLLRNVDFKLQGLLNWFLFLSVKRCHFKGSIWTEKSVHGCGFKFRLKLFYQNRLYFRKKMRTCKPSLPLNLRIYDLTCLPKKCTQQAIKVLNIGSPLLRLIGWLIDFIYWGKIRALFYN